MMIMIAVIDGNNSRMAARGWEMSKHCAPFCQINTKNQLLELLHNIMILYDRSPFLNLLTGCYYSALQISFSFVLLHRMCTEI
ncbi:hypothetical protein B5M10_08340 [Pluralibacter gergoviae]|uniref:Uncharacterized protein n=1 Tax=Pluralibacter gergoviae TaxID=61647 RepID=A0A0F0VAI7_PLUGE|nr:hypothetical protein SS31_22245 [Pluralibacter gergoviae]KMK11285.1 hypothetical protein ABW06_22140 [Pluralibacter gergoviae]OUR02615.1 hypothetical protein B5M10_08340 [Pluralibacter gergoviae]